MLPLTAHLAALALAPLMSRALTGRPRVGAAADGFAQVILAGTLALNVVPYGLASGGLAALVALVGGLGLGLSLHRLPGGPAATGALALAGLAAHGLVDGAALAAPERDHEHGSLLAWAVVLHTVPFGLAVWRVAGERGGWRVGAGLLAASAAATVAGFALSGLLLGDAPAAALGIVQCALAGVLLHVLGHLGAGDAPRWAGLGGLAGAAFLVALLGEHPLPRLAEEELAAGEAGLRLALRTAPAVLVGWLAAGAFAVSARPRLAALAGDGWVGALRGALLAVPLAHDARGALPGHRAVLAAGASPTAALAFLVAGPSLSVLVLGTSAALLGARFAALRALATIAVAAAAGAAAGRGLGPGPARTGGPPPPEGLLARARDAADQSGPWLVAGVVGAALIEPLAAPGRLAGWHGPVAVLGAVTLAAAPHLGASGVTPFVAVLVHKGLGEGAALAFLLAGSGLSLPAVAAVRREHGPAVAARFAAAVLGGVTLAGLVVDALPRDAPPLHDRLGPAGPVGVAALVAVAAVLAGSFLRRGPGGFVEPLLHWGEADPPTDHPNVRVPTGKGIPLPISVAIRGRPDKLRPPSEGPSGDRGTPDPRNPNPPGAPPGP